MGLPDWSITISTSRVGVSQENLTHLILENKWTELSSRKVVKEMALRGFHVSQSMASRALSESKALI